MKPKWNSSTSLFNYLFKTKENLNNNTQINCLKNPIGCETRSNESDQTMTLSKSSLDFLVVKTKLKFKSDVCTWKLKKAFFVIKLLSPIQCAKPSVKNRSFNIERYTKRLFRIYVLFSANHIPSRFQECPRCTNFGLDRRISLKTFCISSLLQVFHN